VACALGAVAPAGRLDEPIERATEITRKTLGWFPIRVWRHFLRANGFLLAAAISYQSLFAIFAVIYFGFAIVGIWLGAALRPSPDSSISSTSTSRASSGARMARGW
jgi:hypothetical protein